MIEHLDKVRALVLNVEEVRQEQEHVFIVLLTEMMVEHRRLQVPFQGAVRRRDSRVERLGLFLQGQHGCAYHMRLKQFDVAIEVLRGIIHLLENLSCVLKQSDAACIEFSLFPWRAWED